MENNNKELYILPFIGMVFLIAGYSFNSFPFLIFSAIAPFFRLHDIFQDIKRPFRFYLIYILFPLTVSYTLIAQFFQPEVMYYQGAFYGLLMSLAFFIFWLTDKYARNRLGYFTLLLYWLAMEYVAIKIHPPFAQLLTGTTFLSFPGLVNWNVSTGIMGISAWILLANVLFYLTFFKGKGILHGNFRPITFSYALILLAIPAAISWWFYDTGDIITTSEAILAYTTPEKIPAKFSSYAITGEVFGRTSAWVSVLLILYSLVKRKVDKV